MDENKQDFKDDKRTIASMNVEGMPWYIGKDTYQKHVDIQSLSLTKEERRAMFWAMVSAMIPIVVIIIIGAFSAFLFLDLVWLS
ncbi:MAG: hypothetical protein RR324_00775 [Cellulosilyticaceae bacterium]